MGRLGGETPLNADEVEAVRARCAAWLALELPAGLRQDLLRLLATVVVLKDPARVERLRSALSEVGGIVGGYLVEHGIAGEDDATCDGDHCLLNVKDAVDTAFLRDREG